MLAYFLGGLPAPVHIGSGKELDPEVFKKCKEKMRDVKKALKALDQPDPDHSEEDQVQFFKEGYSQSHRIIPRGAAGGGGGIGGLKVNLLK